MQCYCCDSKISIGRKVKLRPWREYHPSQGGPNSAAYRSYVEDMTYRWAVICMRCYGLLDNEQGLAHAGEDVFTIAAQSRFDRATVVDEKKWQAFQKQEATKLGLDLG